MSQCAGGLHRPQRADDDDEPALVVADTGTGGAVAVAREALEGRARLEHRVEVADQQHPLAAPAAPRTGGMAGDQVTRAAGRGHVDPADVEAERLQFGAHHLGNRTYAGEVERARVLVDQPLEQCLTARGVGGDRGLQPLGREPVGGDGGAGEQQGGGEKGGTHDLYPNGNTLR